MELIISAFMLGLLGSFHCAGMCGPIAVALPLSRDSWGLRISGAVLYNFGRALTYALMGALFGFFGKGLAIGGLQQWVSVIMGSLMIIAAIFPSLFRNKLSSEFSRFSPIAKLRSALSKLFSKSSQLSLFTIGLLNGLLPCGLVYMAIAGAIASGDVLEGSLFMFVFGVATMPILFAISILGNIVTAGVRKKINKFIPVLIIIIGIFFIMRGLNLGIPYLSPKEEVLKIESTEAGSCCHGTVGGE